MTLQHAEQIGLEFFERMRSAIFGKQDNKTENEKQLHYLRMITDAKKDLATAQKNFNLTTDKELIDCYIYEMKAAETRLNFLMGVAKKEKLENNYFLTDLAAADEWKGSETV